MKLVVLGLSLSSSWGNGHATTYRALLKAFAERGHDVLFLERDQPWYAKHRDVSDPGYCRLALYPSVDALDAHADAIRDADAVMIGSYVPEGAAVTRKVLAWAEGVTAFYDIDTPVTLAKLAEGEATYLEPNLVAGFDLYLSFTGGPTLQRIERQFGARAAKALYCSVDADAYVPLPAEKTFDLGYLGTYSPDRQTVLDRLLIEPARRAPELRFVVAGPLYPTDIAWPANVARVEHVGPGEHAAFYASLRFTLNVTRADMVAAGHSPSVRLFEAAACGVPIVSDAWNGLDELFVPEREILIAAHGDDVVAILDRDDAEAERIGTAGRVRVLAAHTSRHRAEELEGYLTDVLAARSTGIAVRRLVAAV